MNGVILAPTHGYKGLQNDSVANIEKDKTDSVITKQKPVSRILKEPQNVPNDMKQVQHSDLRVIHEGNKNAMDRRRAYLKKQEIRAHCNGVAFPQTDAANLRLRNNIHQYDANIEEWGCGDTRKYNNNDSGCY